MTEETEHVSARIEIDGQSYILDADQELDDDAGHSAPRAPLADRNRGRARPAAHGLGIVALAERGTHSVSGVSIISSMSMMPPVEFAECMSCSIHFTLI